MWSYIVLSILVVNVTSETTEDKINEYTLNEIHGCKPCKICPIPLPVARETPELYWRDFNGPPVPENALVAGTQTLEGGRPKKLFLGQASFPVEGSGLQPVAIFNDSYAVKNSYKRTVSTEENIKILCTNTPPETSETFLKWVPSSEAKTHPDQHLVLAGFESSGTEDYKLFFGRGYLGSTFIAGKAVRKNTPQGFKLYYPWQQGERNTQDDVEILVYAKEFKEF